MIDITRRSALTMVGASTCASLPSFAQGTDTLRLSYDVPLFILPIFVANEKKLWEANGLNATKVPSTSGMTNLIAVSGGATDIGTSAELSVAIAGLTKVRVRIIGSFNKVENMELVCRASIKTPSDLVGKKIAIAQGTPSQYFMSLLLKKYGLRASDVAIVRLGPPEMTSALTGDSIDGFVWQEPFLSKAVSVDPTRFHRLAEPGLVSVDAVLIASDTTIRDRRPVLVKALKAVDQACAMISRNSEEAVRIGALYSSMGASVASEAIRKMNIGLTANVSELSQKMMTEAQWAIAEGLAKSDAIIPNYTDYIDATLLDEARSS